MALLSRNKEKLDGIKAQIEKEGGKGKIITIATDSSDAGQVASAFKTIRDSLGDPEVIKKKKRKDGTHN